MNIETLTLQGIPALLYGVPSNRAFLHVHGKFGCKEEAARFADIACPRGWQVLSIDLPEHGQRKNSPEQLTPWQVIPELRTIYDRMRTRWDSIALYATSMGCWFSMLALPDVPLTQALFVSPVVDMEKLIEKLMKWSGVTPEQLEREKTIPTDWDEVLSWEYYTWVRAHPVRRWDVPTALLFGELDHLTDLATAEDFAHRFGGSLEVIPNSKHWFQDERQLAALKDWTERRLS